MKKFLVFALFFTFTATVYAEKYTYKANTVDEIDIVITAGTLNVKSAKTKDITIDITPDKPEDLSRHISIDTDRDLKVYLDDETITKDTVVTITLPSSKNNIEINSADAEINVSDIKGSLSIDAMNGKIKVENFFGDFEVDTANAEVSAEGGFKELDVESSDADVFVSLRKIPSLYEYKVEGAGKVTLKLPTNFAKAKLKLERKEFYGTLNIQ